MGANGTGLFIGGLEGLWWAGGHKADRRAPADPACLQGIVTGPHTMHQAVNVVEGAVLQRPVQSSGDAQPVQVSDHQAVRVEWA